MNIPENSDTTWTAKLMANFKNVDFNSFAKYFAVYMNETIRDILVQLNQLVGKDPNKKDGWGAKKAEILNLVEENTTTLNYGNANNSNLPTNQKEEKLPIYAILNRLKEVMQKEKKAEEQKNNPNQKTQH